MKKILLTVLGTLALFSCSKDSEVLTTTSQDLTVELAQEEKSVFGTYKGIFTTNNAEYRGTFELWVPSSNSSSYSISAYRVPTVKLTLHTGEVYFSQAESNPVGGRALSNLEFVSDDFTFSFSVNEDGSNPTVTNVTFKNAEGDMLLAKHTQRAPVNPRSGTWDCTTCNGHPVVGQGGTQTFNMMFVTADGNSTITTQSTINSTTTDGIGVQSNCMANGDTTVCTIESGDGTTTTTGFLSNGNPVTWLGTHTFNNEVSGPDDCSTLQGTWEWESISYGTLEGNFITDIAGNCPITDVTLINEDFEDATVSYVASFDDLSGENDDYFRITNGTDISATINNVQGSQFFAAQDTDGVAGNGQSPANLTWSNLNITGLTNINFSAFFAEDDASDAAEDWDNADFVDVQYSFDGTTYTTFFSIRNDGSTFNAAPQIDTDLDGVGDGAIITDNMANYSASFPINGTTNPTASTELWIRVNVGLDSGDEDIAFDDFIVIGN
ncbi:hypothetical protein [Marinirhabdus gelatinilytica]|uniref:Uncharacterized protein n=1 Tax=Marinirhabdus gelatinilytica TaxID=1703343 RepID=A0A370QGB0_9FLAO|nr:hypothetical protein [Marinirhabdus gelatinilytica]RDK87402.1 hypothetical protein C8D94_102591 [Marinirhabdus gelatinilytica]